MGSVAEAVLEFDEAVQVPWRPPLAGAARPAQPRALREVPAVPHRRVHAARAARLLAVVEPPAAPRPVPPRTPRPVSLAGGSTAVGHSCARCSQATGRPAPAVRLTHRARRLLVILGAAAGVLVGLGIGSVAGGGEELVLVSDSSVVVQQGDTVWSIARSVAGDQDVRSVVDAIQELNDLHDATLRPGQVLRLP
jgi:nucleoid-associated protein YgaU